MRFIQSGHAAAIALLVAIVATPELRSQTISRDPSAAEVAALLRNRGHVGGALSVLTQARGTQSQKQMDEIADSLVVIAASFPGNDLRGSTTRGAAEIALMHAGMGESGIVGVDHAVPYAGASVRLMRLVETAEDVGVRAASLWALTQVRGNKGWPAFVQQVATSQNRVAHVAITVLNEEGGPEGRAILRELYRSGRVTDPAARDVLSSMAHGYGWR